MKKLDLQQLQQKVAIERDEQAYRQMFFYYYPRLSRFALPFVGIKEAAEEVVSDVMLRVWALGDGLQRIDNLTVYLFRATRNRSLNYIRDHQKHAARSLDLLEDTLPYTHTDPETSLLQNEWKSLMQAAVERLPPRCGTVYRLVRENGLSYREVAAIMEISENTVDRHLNNALHKLVKAVKTYAMEA